MAETQTTSTSRSADILARLNRIPVWSLPRYYLVVIGLGYLFTIYNIGKLSTPSALDRFRLF